MRRVLCLTLAVSASISAGARARADGQLAMRGVYYKERSTRVEQPMIDGLFDAGDDLTVDGHFLVDAITSASTASGASAKPFTEKRYELGLGLVRAIDGDAVPALHGDAFRVGAHVRGSTEPDYTSLFAGVRVEGDFAKKNFTVSLGGGAGRDHVTNAGAQGDFVTPISERLVTAMVSASATQVLGENAIASVTYDLSRQSGYLENPYRTVITGDGLVPERVPDARLRHAVAGIVRLYVPQTETVVIGGYRYYRDDWGVTAHTPEVRVVQAAGDDLEVGVGLRYHRQGAASFYEPVYPTSNPVMEPWLTDDPKLSKFDGETLSAKFAVLGSGFGLDGDWAGVRAEVIFEYVVQHNRFGNAGVAHVALTVPFAY